jgi:RimJ/RimL family protein N-acetyltransferase
MTRSNLLGLRLLEANDAFMLAAMLDDEDIAHYANLPFSGSLRAAQKGVARLIAAEGKAYIATVHNMPIGYGSLRPCGGPETQEVAFAVASQWRSQGYGSQICRLLTTLATHDLRIRLLVGHCHAENEFAQRVLLGCGFQREPSVR